MWEGDPWDMIDETEGQSRSVLGEAYSSSVHFLFDLTRNSVKPLYRIDVRDTEVVVTVDLPGVEKGDISLSASEDTVNIEAKMRRPVSLMVGGTYQRRVRFERYAKSIRLPVRIEPGKAKAKVRNGLLTVRFPLVRNGTTVEVK